MKNDLKQAAIDVFGNVTALVSNSDYIELSPSTVLSPRWAYPTINAFNDGSPHPFPIYTGGFEEKGRNSKHTVLPPHIPSFFFNDRLSQKLNSIIKKTVYHNIEIQTLKHKNYGRTGKVSEIKEVYVEQPDLFTLGDKTTERPCFNGNSIESAIQCGHNFIGQVESGLLNKQCHELKRLKDSGIPHNYFISLYSHMTNLSISEAGCMNKAYVDANAKADKDYAKILEVYRNDIRLIDGEFIHLIFKGFRPSCTPTYYHVFIFELPKDFEFIEVKINNRNIQIRPSKYF